MISQKYRFHGHGSLRYILANGKQARGKNISIKYVDNKRRLNHRAAIIISKKVCKHAIDRNRIRRRLYEIIRKRLVNFNNNIDIIITVYQADILNKPFLEIEQEVDHCLTKLGI